MSSIEIKSELLAFQNETIKRMKIFENMFDGGMLLNAPGTGKSLVSLVNILKEKKIKKTLIICPSGLVNNWIDEIKKHTNFDIKKICKYHGNKKNELDFKKCSIFITSYSIIAKEFTKEKTNESLYFYKDSLFAKENFERIILDEAHYIRNNNSISKSIIYLGELNKNSKKWIVTATPIFNSFKDLFNYFKFLEIENNKREWIKSIQKESLNGFKILNENIKKYSICYKKEDVLKELTPKNEISKTLKFSKLEFEFYSNLVDYSQNRMISLIKKIKRLNASHLDIDGSIRKLMRSNIMVYILRLKQACNSPWLILGKMERLKNCKNLKEAVVKLDYYNKSKVIDEECPICYDTIANKIADPCGHKCCKSCWKKMFNLEIFTCPKCRKIVQEIQDTDTQNKIQSESEIKNDSEKLNFMSSKIKYLVDLTKEIISKNEKIVIVSQWVTMLDFVRNIFNKNTSLKFIKSINLQGNISISKRLKNINEFQNNKNTKICFISLMSSAEGINLTSANNLVLLDSWWNNSKMLQVSDRIHRIGQSKKVNIYKLYIENTIEENIKKRLDQKSRVNNLVLNKWNIKKKDYDDSWINNIVKLIEKNPDLEE